jgi:hypothetical protein
MRQRFEQQMNLSTVALAAVKFPLKSLDELPPFLMVLQYIFITPALNERLFELLKKRYVAAKRKQAEKEWTCGSWKAVALICRKEW